MGESYSAHVFVPGDEPFPWSAVQADLSGRLPLARISDPDGYEGVSIVFEDDYEIGVIAEHDVAEFIGELLDDVDAALADDVVERLNKASTECTLRIEIIGDNDMDSSEHFNDWALVTEVIEEASAGAVTVDATELE